MEFYVIKDIDEPFMDKVKRRIDKVTPMHATRMGPAIRHATSKLETQDAKTKILFPDQRWPSPGQGVQSGRGGERVRRPRHPHGPGRGQAQVYYPLLSYGGQVGPRLPQGHVRRHELRGAGQYLGPTTEATHHLPHAYHLAR